MTTPLHTLHTALARSASLDVEDRGAHLVARRVRAVPRRGLLRLLLPWAHAIVRARGSDAQVSVRPDALALFMVVMLLGGVGVELFLDRARYPREYPPAFIYGLAAFYFGALALELRTTARAVNRELARLDGR